MQLHLLFYCGENWDRHVITLDIALGELRRMREWTDQGRLFEAVAHAPITAFAHINAFDENAAGFRDLGLIDELSDRDPDDFDPAMEAAFDLEGERLIVTSSGLVYVTGYDANGDTFESESVELQQLEAWAVEHAPAEASPPDQPAPLKLSAILGDMLAYEADKFDATPLAYYVDHPPNPDARPLLPGPQPWTTQGPFESEVQARQVMRDESELRTEFGELNVSGGDLVDAFTEWRGQIRAALPELAAVATLRTAAGELASTMEEALGVHVYDFQHGDKIEPDCGYLAAINSVRAALGWALLDTDLEEIEGSASASGPSQPSAPTPIETACAALWAIARRASTMEEAPVDDEYDDTESAYLNGWAVTCWGDALDALEALAALGDDDAKGQLARMLALQEARDRQHRDEADTILSEEA